MPLAIPLAVLVFATAYIPVIGSILAGAVAALVAFVTGGPIEALIVIAIVIAVNQFEGNVLQPVVMGRTVSLHPLTILLVLTAGTVLAGIVGALLAVPITSVVWAAIKGWRAPPDPALADPRRVPNRRARPAGRGRSRSGSIRHRSCMRSSMSTTGMSSAYCSASRGSSRMLRSISCTPTPSRSSSPSTRSTTARASSQRWHPGLAIRVRVVAGTHAA